MEKTKIGLSVRLVGALCFLMCLFGGYTPALLLTGYILLCETDSGLKKTAISSILLLVLFSAVSLVIGLLPEVMDVFESMAAIFDEYLGVRFVDNLASFLYCVMTVVRTVVFAGLAVLEFLGKPQKLSFLDKLIDR